MVGVKQTNGKRTDICTVRHFEDKEMV